MSEHWAFGSDHQHTLRWAGNWSSGRTWTRTNGWTNRRTNERKWAFSVCSMVWLTWLIEREKKMCEWKKMLSFLCKNHFSGAFLVKNILKKCYTPSGKKRKTEKCPQKALRSFWKKEKTKKCPQKALRSFWKQQRTKKCPQKALRLFWNKAKNWKMPSKSVTVLLEKKKKIEKCLQKALRPFWE